MLIIFEAGPTHTGLVSAIRLAEATQKAGADYIKFQMVDPDRLISDKTQLVACEILNKDGRTETFSEPLYDNLKRYSLSRPDWRTLISECRALRLPVVMTVAYEDEVDFCQELGIQEFKICS